MLGRIFLSNNSVERAGQKAAPFGSLRCAPAAPHVKPKAKPSMRLRTLYFVVALLSASKAMAIDPQQADSIIDYSLQHFWGKAVLMSGAKVQASNEAERSRLPIDRVYAREIVDASVPAGFGEWCNANWKSYYLSYMQFQRHQRQKSLTEVQAAFVGYLFGVAQGEVIRSASKNTCTTDDNKRVEELLANAIRNIK